jgi:DNA-binding CsgD family transcriptional regulator
MIAIAKTLIQTLTEPQAIDNIHHNSKHSDFWQEVIEGLEDGILILNQAGKIVYANASAYRFCCQLNEGNFNSNFVPDFSRDLENLSLNLSPTRRETLNLPPSRCGKGVRGLGFSSAFPHDVKSQNFVPISIWNLCESLLSSWYQLYDKFIILSDEIVLDKSNIFRIRVRLLDLDGFDTPNLLVTIENQYESLKNATLTEVKKFELTRREAEIWFLYRNHYTYKEIATKLYITLNTVKKHMKNIHAKRQTYVVVEGQDLNVN